MQIRVGSFSEKMIKMKSKELEVLKRFLMVYCNNHHAPQDEYLCEECCDLFEYAQQRLEKCPYDPKPKCKDCPTHCYRPDYRKRIREVMRSSGMYFVKHGRLDWLVRYFKKPERAFE